VRGRLSKVAFAILVTLLCAAATPAPRGLASLAASSASSEGVGAQQGPPAHVMVIVEENRNRSEVIGASNMPYFNSLALRYGNTTDWNEVSHPSLPNYLALASGSTQGVTDDGCEYSFSGVPTIGSQLSAAGISWKAYLEGLPEPGSEVCLLGGYAKKHNPFAYFPETNGSHVVPATQFQTDESSGQLPAFMFYAPNSTYDGHSGTNEQVDNYLKNLVPNVLASRWYSEGGTVIITWDESKGEGKIPTVVLKGRGSGKALTARGNHYGTLSTIEGLYRLPLLGNAVGAATLTPLLTPHWYNNGALREEGQALPALAWGTLTLTNASVGAVRCKTVAGIQLENPPGGGAGKGRVLALLPYACVAPACEASGGKAELVPEKLPWTSVLIEEASLFRDTLEGIALRAICVAAKQSVQFHGSLKPEVTNGTAIGYFPSKLAFGAGSGSLESTAGAGELSGKVKLMGYGGLELTQVKDP
jgi:hypothetical protein